MRLQNCNGSHVLNPYQEDKTHQIARGRILRQWPGKSQNRAKWLGDQDSNLGWRSQRVPLHQ